MVRAKPGTANQSLSRPRSEVRNREASMKGQQNRGELGSDSEFTAERYQSQREV